MPIGVPAPARIDGFVGCFPAPCGVAPMFEGGVIGGRVGVDEPGFLVMIDGDGDVVVDSIV